ncbi:hypothetical protein BJ138DRAFT_1079047 [Hygrophoropsis aurantiaca]|uniref:Uncharacterized protein n=1 Tax=Hygrophoropsis aurantiaca TaxID=72124 RepID=A0ACB8AMU0_9AGAM|nr:hypothetical protein BJ138DRAFT_1079047 [Hygrophoropsis aurantiaca]
MQWSLSEFLYHLFQLEEADNSFCRQPKHQQVLVAFMNGSSTHTFGEIIELIYKNAVKIKHSINDPLAPKESFVRNIDPSQLLHARPALSTWAVNLVAKLVRKEADILSHANTGLHLRATTTGTRASSTKNLVSWDKVDAFSYSAMQDNIENHAPILWHILNCYVDPDYAEGKQVIREYHPQNLICTDSILELTCGRSSHANMYSLIRGIWLFATKAHKSTFRVESRVARCVSQETVRQALRAMAEKKRADLRHARRDHRIGRENTMMKGFAGMAVEITGFEEGAFDINKMLDCQKKQERSQLTTDTILEDIDWAHIDQVTALQFVAVLVHFVPTLSHYKQNLDHARQALTKHQIPPTQKTNIIPLATNSADEIHIQGMQEAVMDFLDIQMGVTKDTLNDRIMIFSGDGKTFDQLLKLKKYLSPVEDNYGSLRFLIALLELWHTKWTDLSRTIRAHWGTNFTHDPSTLAFVARLAECPTPSDLRKVPFYDGAHLLNLALDANILNCWEYFFQCSNLVEHFEQLQSQNNIPDFESLCSNGQTLARRHATTQAFERAHKPEENHPDNVPLGSPWTHGDNHDDVEMENPGDMSDQIVFDGVDALSDLSDYEDHPMADISLGNTTLFMRNGIWWREMCESIAQGDTGRVWEIMKIWIFTFSGSSNPYYSQYLLELFCSFKWELPPKLKDAIFNSWLANPRGEPGQFVELDLTQEHSNRLLEDMAQHKGKAFDEPFYRNTVSMHILHFLHLIDEMENHVSLKARSKKHSAPHLKRELRVIMDELRAKEINRRRPGRNEGFCATDDFKTGLAILKKDKLKNFLIKTTTDMDLLGTTNEGGTVGEGNVEDEWNGAMRDELEREGQRAPPQMRYVDGRLNTDLFVDDVIGD